MVSVATVRGLVSAAVDVDAGILEQMILQARSIVQTQTNRYFGPLVTQSDYLSGNGSRHLRLHAIPIVVDDEYDLTVIEREYPGATTATTLDPSEYQLRQGDKQSTLVRTGGEKWIQGYEYEVIYERGYDEDDGPKDVEQLIVRMVEAELNLRGKTGIRSESSGGYSVTFATEASLASIPGAMDTIKAWRRLVLA